MCDSWHNYIYISGHLADAFVHYNWSWKWPFKIEKCMIIDTIKVGLKIFCPSKFTVIHTILLYDKFYGPTKSQGSNRSGVTWDLSSIFPYLTLFWFTNIPFVIYGAVNFYYHTSFFQIKVPWSTGKRRSLGCPLRFPIFDLILDFIHLKNYLF